MHTTKLEKKAGKPAVYAFHPVPLKADAFARPVDLKITDRARFLANLYQPEEKKREKLVLKEDLAYLDGKPEYDYEKNKVKYQAQMRKLCQEFELAAQDYKVIPENLANILKFPAHLFQLIDENPTTTPYGTIKEQLEELLMLLREKKVVSKELIKAQHLAEKKKNDKLPDLSEEELNLQFELEKKEAALIEERKYVVLANVLPEILKCNTGIPGHLDFAVQLLSGGNTADDVLCDLRTDYVTVFGNEYKRFTTLDEGTDIHVPVVLRNHAIKEEKWEIRSKLGGFEDRFKKLTKITDPILEQFRDGFGDYYQLRSMADRLCKKFEELLAKKRPRLFGEEAKGQPRYQWIEYKAENVEAAQDILKKWNMDSIASGDLFELDSSGKMRFSPLLFKQNFWQFCQKQERYVEKEFWAEEKEIFADYVLWHPKSAAFTDLAWIEMSEASLKKMQAGFVSTDEEKTTHVERSSTKKSAIPFDQLPEAEKMRYYIYSTVRYGFPDRYNWLESPKSFFELVVEENDLKVFAKALDKQNQFDRHRTLLKKLLHEYPHRLTTILLALHPSKAMAILDIVEIDYQWTHATDFPWQKIKIEESGPDVKENYRLEEPLSWNAGNRIGRAGSTPEEDKKNHTLITFIRARLQDRRAKIAKFQQDYGLPETLPIPYSFLLSHADSATAEDQFIYKMYLQQYFNIYSFQEEKPDYAKIFKKHHEDLLKKRVLTAMQEQYLSLICDGDLESLKTLKVSVTDIIPEFTLLMHRLQHKHLLSHFFKLAAELCQAGHSPFSVPLLGWAVRFNQIEAFQNLMALHDKNVNAPLIYAADMGLIKLAKELIAAGANIEYESENLNSLMIASYNGYSELVIELLNHHANFKKIINNKTALYFAVLNGHIETARLLLEKNAPINLRHAHSLLCVAVKDGNLEMVKLLVEHGADVNLISYLDKHTALFAAAQVGHLHIVKYLLQNGANPVLCLDDITPLKVAKTSQIHQVLLAAELRRQPTISKQISHELSIVEPVPAVYKDNGWVGWVGWFENQNGEVVTFEDLSAEQKMQYHIYCMVNHDFPDHLNIRKPAVDFEDIFTEKKSLQDLAKELEKQNKFVMHATLFKTILKNNPERLTIMLQAMRPENARQILDMLDIEFHCLHPTSVLHKQATKVLFAADSGKTSRIENFVNIKAIFQKFQREYKQNENTWPILYSTLLAHAEHAKPDEQIIYKMYLKFYFSRDYLRYERTIAKPDYAKLFLSSHQREPKGDERIYILIRDNNLAELKKLNVTSHQFHVSGINRIELEYDQLNAHFYGKKSGMTKPLLHFSVMFDQKEEIDRLLLSGNVNELDEYKNTVLMHAAEYGRDDLIKKLLNIKADINSVSSLGYDSLSLSCSNSHSTTTRLLLERNAIVTHADKDGRTPLVYSIRRGLDCIANLLEKGADVNVAINTANNPLLNAVECGFIDVAHFLLEHGAKTDMSLYPNLEFNPLREAIKKGNLAMVQLLVQYGADVHTWYAFESAVQDNQLDIAIYLLQKGAKTDTKFKNGSTCLHTALRLGNASLIKSLLEYKADINMIDNNETTALHQAVAEGKFAMVQLLFQNGADINITNPLFAAIENGHPDIALYLLQNGAKTDTKSKTGSTCLHRLVQYGNTTMIRALLEHKTDVNAADSDGLTPLHLAAASGNMEIVEILLKAGADATLQAKNQKTPAQSAISPEMRVKLLIHQFKDEPKQRKFIFENYAYVQPRTQEPGIFWIESKSGDPVLFKDLPLEEQMHYFIYSTVVFDNPDYYQLSKPPTIATEIFVKEPDLQALAKQLEAENQLDKHESLFRAFFRSHPDRLYTMLCVMDPNKALRVLNLIDFDFHSLHGETDLQSQTMQLRKLLSEPKTENQKILFAFFDAHMRTVENNFSRFCHANKLKEKPFPTMSSLMKCADKKLTPSDQMVYQVCLQHYLPDLLRLAEAEEKINYADVFKKAMSNYNKWGIAVIDGRLDDLVTLRLGGSDFIEKGYFKEACRFYQKSILDHFSKSVNYEYKIICEQKVPPSLLTEAYVKSGDAEMLLQYISLTRSVDMIKVLCVSGVNVNSTSGPTLYNIAGFHGLIENLRMLLEYQANANQVSRNTKTPCLINAVSYGRLAKVRLLISYHADVNVVSPDGYTALFIAAKYNDLAMTQCLLAAGANPVVRCESKTPYEIATNPQVRQILLAAELKIELTKALEFKSADDSQRFFSLSDNVQQIQSSQNLLAALQGRELRHDLDEAKEEFAATFKGQPWKRFYDEALKLASEVPKSKLEMKSTRS